MERAREEEGKEMEEDLSSSSCPNFSTLRPRLGTFSTGSLMELLPASGEGEGGALKSSLGAESDYPYLTRVVAVLLANRERRAQKEEGDKAGE
eukprot:CAMPEP_0119122388 /NCGR_PEP_ID=MMETSP1310-20130426/2659_1 /TAXON_ID=464262 /ORGANISM="Genus nov. species nov., Strain RCC2339" /LENGTH=92 /DNA_ID=CAMNT_0007112037 /DNA_START=77 /DNA_END=352 /DNA_ORIENTATION=+